MSMTEISKKIAHLEGKIHAIEETLYALKSAEDINIQEMLKIIRKLSKKQFNALIKRRNLVFHQQ